MDKLSLLLKQKFGFSTFRPGQKEAILALLEEKKILCIQPTGHGKSLLYQLPSLLVDGMTIVISPLLALIRDQLDHLENRFDIAAASINSDQSEEENQQSKNLATQGRLNILFISPEQLDNLEASQFILSLPIGLIVIDEAHCISTWGHDFRPSYRQIVKAIHQIEEKHPNLHVLGLTATADEKTEKDIAKQLSPKGHLKILRHSMDRPNLSLSVVQVSGLEEKLEYLLEDIKERNGSGIIYCATREHTEIVAEFLKNHKIHAAAYHAGLAPEEKRQLQKAFINDQFKVISATNALGMGVDKPNVRYIYHFDFPGSITAYYQEVGRAGRDGLPACGILLFDLADEKIQEHFINSAQPSQDDFNKIIEVIMQNQNTEPPNLTQIKSRSGLHPTRTTVILAELIEQKIIEKKLISRRQVYEILEPHMTPDLSRYKRQSLVRKNELRAMKEYGHLHVTCLMNTLRNALGDNTAQGCQRCSLCLGKSLRAEDKLSKTRISEVQTWLNHRVVAIPATKRPKASEGIALLNGELRLPLFIQFMKNRTNNEFNPPPQLYDLLSKNLSDLNKKWAFSAIVTLPSRTWAQRSTIASWISKELNVPDYSEILEWADIPQSRQGELLNNDQRRENVTGKLQLKSDALLLKDKNILLIDDYTGSGATLTEAVRTLRRQVQGEIVPFTIARVRWRLGAKGMI